MSDRPLLARLATDLLADEARGGGAKVHGPTEAERARAIAVAAAAIAKAAAARRVARRRRVGVGVGLAVAAAVGGLVAIRLRAPVTASAPVATTTVHAHALAGEPTLWRLGMSEPLHGAVTLVPGDRVRAAAGASAELQMSTGSKVAVEEGGDLTLVGVQSADVLALSAGAARFEVAKVTAGRKFLVRTGDAEIEVKGTAFRVSVVPVDPSCSVATPTRVEVTEGRVVVRFHGEEAVLVAGGKWPSGCSGVAKDAKEKDGAKVAPPVAGLGAPTATEPTGVAVAKAPIAAPLPAVVAPAPTAPQGPPGVPQSTVAPAATPAATTTAPTATPAAPTATTVAVAPKKASDLASQNDLFTFGLEKKKAGDFAAARAAFDRYLSLYPNGALAESATVEKMRLSSGATRKELAAAYLARWPKGFARAEAQSIVGD